MTSVFAINRPCSPSCRTICDVATLATPPQVCQQRAQRRHAVACAAAPRTSLGPMVGLRSLIISAPAASSRVTPVAAKLTSECMSLQSQHVGALQAEHAADDLLDELPGSDAFAELVRLAVAADPSLADSPAVHGMSPPLPSDAKKPAWLRQRAPQGVSPKCTRSQMLDVHTCHSSAMQCSQH